MKSSPSDDRLLGCLVLAVVVALLFLAVSLAWNTFVLPPGGFAP